MIGNIGDPQFGVVPATSSTASTSASDEGNTGRWLREMEQAEFAGWFVRDQGDETQRETAQEPADRKHQSTAVAASPEPGCSPGAGMEPAADTRLRVHEAGTGRGPRSGRTVAADATRAAPASAAAVPNGTADGVTRQGTAGADGIAPKSVARSSGDLGADMADPMWEGPAIPAPAAPMFASTAAPVPASAAASLPQSPIETASAWLMRDFPSGRSAYADTLPLAASFPDRPSAGAPVRVATGRSTDRAGGGEGWQKQVTHAYLGPDGVTIWLRDTDLGESRASSVVRSISEWAAESGIAVKQIHLNGRRIYARREYKQKF